MYNRGKCIRQYDQTRYRSQQDEDDPRDDRIDGHPGQEDQDRDGDQDRGGDQSGGQPGAEADDGLGQAELSQPLTLQGDQESVLLQPAQVRNTGIDIDSQASII